MNDSNLQLYIVCKYKNDKSKKIMFATYSKEVAQTYVAQHYKLHPFDCCLDIMENVPLKTMIEEDGSKVVDGIFVEETLQQGQYESFPCYCFESEVGKMKYCDWKPMKERYGRPMRGMFFKTQDVIVARSMFAEEVRKDGGFWEIKKQN